MLLVKAVVYALAAFAKRSPNRGAARGFGSPPPPPTAPTARTATAASKPKLGSLERKLVADHNTNCESSAERWATCDGTATSAYEGGWHEYPCSTAVSPGNVPYNTDRLLVKSRAPLLSETECRALIDQMEAHGAAFGFDARYPVAGFTREVNVGDIPASVELLNDALQRTLLPAAAAAFASACDPSSLRVNEALVVKYDAATGNNCLPVHQDFSLLTLNVALSDSSDYDGGGTWFECSGDILLAERGEAVLHAGGLRHCGVPVRSGVRYQLVLFLLSTEHPDVAGRLQAIGAAAGAKAGAKDVPLSSVALERASRLNPLDGETWSLLGLNRRHEGDLEGAAAAFERAVAISGRRDFGALVQLAGVRSAQSRPAEALEVLQDALQVGAPPSPSQAAEMLEAQHNVGIALMSTGAVEEAGMVFESIIEVDPDAADSWAALGLCMAKLGQEDAAIVCQKQVVRLQHGVPSRADPKPGA